MSTKENESIKTFNRFFDKYIYIHLGMLGWGG